MAAKSWNVIANRRMQQLLLKASDVPGAPAAFTVTTHTGTSGLSQGVEELRVHNGALSYSILLTRGMGLWNATLGDLPIGWRSPVQGPVHPAFVPLMEPSGLGWLEGFDEWICRCGAASNGAPDFNEKGQLTYPLHGFIANRPAQEVTVTVEDDQIRVSGVVSEARFHFHKFQLRTTIVSRFNQPGLEIHDELHNLSGVADEMQMLYHCNFGTPILGAGAEVVVPADKIVPRNAWAAEGIGHWSTFTEPHAGMPERVYLMQLHANSENQTHALLKSGDAQRGVSLRWDVRQLPFFTLWKNEASLEDGYVTGLEPGTNFPNPRTFEGKHGRVIKLAPGGSHKMSVSVDIHATAADVQKAENAVKSIAGGRMPRVESQPTKDWCAG